MFILSRTIFRESSTGTDADFPGFSQELSLLCPSPISTLDSSSFEIIHLATLDKLGWMDMVKGLLSSQLS